MCASEFEIFMVTSATLSDLTPDIYVSLLLSDSGGILVYPVLILVHVVSWIIRKDTYSGTDLIAFAPAGID